MTHDDFLDPGTAERMLDRTVAAADAPPGYAPVVSVLSAASAGISVPEMDFEELARVARRAADRSGPSTTRRSPMIGKLLTIKAAAAAGVILIGATGAAAATGTLPGAVQRAAHSTLAHVGVDVPDDDTSTDDPANAHEPADPTVPADPSAPPTPTDGTGAGAGDNGTGDHADDPATVPGATNGDDQSGDQSDDPADDGDGATVTPPASDPSTDSGSNSDPGSGDAGSGGDGSGSDGSGHGGGDSSGD